ncbi:MAG TPA: tryptophan synthase subunit alpha [Candidatus Dormibacteraeota bacterium]|jgi:tryptophan synthase alpha chain|nr:tryptophan synthase subunit alpha [Candidatus Dormibacteraeota bacterium]
MSRLAATFDRLRAEERLGFCAYLTVGYPHQHDTPAMVEAVVAAGADVIELGLPFSDPLAEGRTVQRTSQRALENGVTTAFCLETARRCRELTGAPLVLMGYVNPILAYGTARFCQDAAAAGADGLIVVDLALEEAEDLHGHCREHGLDLVFLVAPTSTDRRIETIARLASGFLYCVAVTGVTGSRDQLGEDVDGLLERVRARVGLPLGLGFGLSRPEHLERLRGRVDMAIVGSALLDAVTAADPSGSAAGFVRWMRSGIAPAPGAAVAG